MSKHLDLDEVIKSRVHRILKQMSSYHAIDSDTSTLAPFTKGYSFTTDEHPLGVYENASGDPHENILITTRGLRIFHNGHLRFIDYAAINGVEISLPKELVDTLQVRLQSGEMVEIPVRGGEGGMRDVWEFMRYVMRVSQDARSRAANHRG